MTDRSGEALQQGQPVYSDDEDDLTPQEWIKAARFAGFKNVEEYKQWIRLMRLQAGCFMP